MKNAVNRVVFRLRSERIMGSTSLQPDMNHESKELRLEDGLLERLKDKYCCRVKVRRSSSSSQPGTKPSEGSALDCVTAGQDEVFAGQNH